MTRNLYNKNGRYIDLVIRLGSFWVGVHYTEQYNSYCVAIIPCVILRFSTTKYNGQCKVA